MALSYKARRFWSVIILVVGLPLYIIVAISAVSYLEFRFGRPGILLEIFIYIVLGVAWALPFKSVFKGIGQADPDAKPDAQDE